LRTPGFIRVSGAERTVIGMDVYARKTREMFDTLRQRGTQASIDLRFVERLAGAEQAFETGIWALRMVRSTGESTMHYGRFQALSVRTGGRWRLLMDHDVPLSAAEGARQFAEASPMSS
jgi:ketosteroid isomerase-like protein